MTTYSERERGGGRDLNQLAKYLIENMRRERERAISECLCVKERRREGEREEEERERGREGKRERGIFCHFCGVDEKLNILSF